MKNKSFTVKTAAILAMALLLTACGGNAAATTTTTTAETTTTTEAATTTSAATTAAEELTEAAYTPALYKVSDEDSTVYLFGAVHCGNEKTTAFPDYVTDAYNDSEIIACEIDAVKLMTDQEALQEVNKITLCESGKTTGDYLDAEIFADTKAVFQELGIYNALYELYKPGMWSSLAAQYMMMGAELSSDYGVDGNIIARATADGKEIVELETPVQQYELLFNGSEEYYSYAFLTMSTKELIDEQIALLVEMHEAWANGSMKQYFLEHGDEDIPEEEMKAAGVTDEMLAAAESYGTKMNTDRNIEMNEKTKELLAGDKNVFVTVGAMHIESEDGIVALLTAEGYTVERVG